MLSFFVFQLNTPQSQVSQHISNGIIIYILLTICWVFSDMLIQQIKILIHTPNQKMMQHQERSLSIVNLNIDTIVQNICFFVNVFIVNWNNRLNTSQYYSKYKCKATLLQQIASLINFNCTSRPFQTIQNCYDAGSWKQTTQYETIVKSLQHFGSVIKQLYKLVDQGQKNLERQRQQSKISKKVCQKNIYVKLNKPLCSFQLQIQRIKLIIESMVSQMIMIIEYQQLIIYRLLKYDPYANNLNNTMSTCQEEELSQTASRETQNRGHKKQKEMELQADDINDEQIKQVIRVKDYLEPDAFTWIQQQTQRLYLSEVTKAYHEIVPFKIRNIGTYISENQQNISIQIRTSNYFSPTLPKNKAILPYCQPKTKKVYYYQLYSVWELLFISKQYIKEVQLNIPWNFGPYVKTLITRDGQMYCINCQTIGDSVDPFLYQINVHQNKITNCGEILNPTIECGFIYCNKFLYKVGGRTSNGTFSNRNYKCNIQTKKWIQVSNSASKAISPTLCVFKQRYIVKLGGYNESGRINKNIQIYDTILNHWQAFSINSNVQILYSSLAVQINTNQIFVFAGKNNNNYSSDTAFLIDIKQEQEKQQQQFHIQIIYRKNILSFWGMHSSDNIIIHQNCIVVMRIDSQNLL